MFPNISPLCFTNSVHSMLSFIRPEIPHLLIDVKGGWRLACAADVLSANREICSASQRGTWETCSSWLREIYMLNFFLPLS